MQKYCILLLISVFAFQTMTGQHSVSYTKADTLRGSNTSFRDFWDVLHYEVTVKPNFERKSLDANSKIKFKLNENYRNQRIMQVDLQGNLFIDSISVYVEDKGANRFLAKLSPQKFKRDGNIYWVNLENLDLMKEGIYMLDIDYSGKVTIAENAPWDGGWVFTKDEKNRPWMSAACQELGSSVWYPCKDYQGDEPDEGATLNIITSGDLVGVGNGRLQEKKSLSNGNTLYKWVVTQPINNYNIIPYIGHYVNFEEQYKGLDGSLDLSYWVLDYNLEKAKEHFKIVPKMISIFEDWMGPYPFYEDSFKLVDAPYLGMEHQSAIAYGNEYKMGYTGYDISGTGAGSSWDYIIVHEAGHEWFGNSITTNDIADMWVQEGFTTYSETMFVEGYLGRDKAFEYIRGQRNSISNDKPIIGDYFVNHSGSSDMYFKGANMIHSIRLWMNDDATFKAMIRDIQKKFRHTTVDTEDIENYIIDYTSLPLKGFFNQYLRTVEIPVLEIKDKGEYIQYRYSNVVEGFEMPIQLNDGNILQPSTSWKKYPSSLNNLDVLDAYLVKFKLVK